LRPPGTCATLVALATLLTVVGSAAADELVGLWVPEGLTPEILTAQPQNVRVLSIRETRDGLVGKVLIPALAGVPVAVERHDGRIRLVIQQARGMDSPLDATLAGDRLSITTPGSQQPASVLRRI